MTGTILGAPDIGRALTRIAHEILERNEGHEDIVLLGIPTRGVPLAQRLAANLAEVEPGFDAAQRTGALDITMYRDDLRSQPTRTIGATTLPSVGIDGKVVVLVDDVFHTGRTIRAALDAIKDEGRPRAVQARRARGPRTPRTTHPCRLRGEEHPHLSLRAGRRPPR
ncbi:hypothetical protein GCM10025876_38890 [Demequina litorisediminis]|uniref:Phosphoribosyltransferase domain-containing protein n=1 Tax=Demequina litorisediminis TaxID=1849022 RepID=A0ABQ6IIN3_9MICO|nr:hypothetical protein GCM10025876_38890 [Demequina litorisediminis]